MSKVHRSVRVPIERPDDETWKRLRALACQAARYGNRMLAGQYVAKTAKIQKPLLTQLDAALFADSNDELSGWVRGAMTKKCKAQWKRAGRDVLAGRERLACFSADRALSIDADQSNNRGVLYERDGDDFVLACRFEPVQIRDEAGKLTGTREPIRLRLALNTTAMRKDLFIRARVEAIWSGADTPSGVTLRFDKIHRKLDARITFSQPAAPALEGGCGATLGPIDGNGRYFMRFDAGGSVDYGDRIELLVDKKKRFADTVSRLAHHAGRAGRKGRKYKYRRKLRSIGSFDTWSEGKIHEWSMHVIEECKKAGVTRLMFAPIEKDDEGMIPWHRLRWCLKYKAEDNGITYSEEPAGGGATRAAVAPLRKLARDIKKAREGLDAAHKLADGVARQG